MRALTVLTVGVSLVFGLRGMDISGEGDAANQASLQQAAAAAVQRHDYTEAARLFGECVKLSKAGGERLTALVSYGIALRRVNRNAEAKSALEQALTEWGDASAADRVVVSGALAAVDRSLGDYQGAERVLRAAMGDRSASGANRATLMVSLADLLREEARASEARAVLNEVSQFTGLSQRQQTSILVETAQVTSDMGFWSESAGLWNEAGEIADREHSSQLEAVVTGGLGETWLNAGNLARAEPLLRRLLQLVREDSGASLSQVATALALMARLYIEEDKLALADEALDEAIAKTEASRSEEHPQVALLLELRATILSRRGETQAARYDLERARVIMSSHFGANSTAVAAVFGALGDLEQRANRPAVAVQEYGRAMRLLRDAGTDSATLGPGLLKRYAAALRAVHRPDEARALLQSSKTAEDAGKTIAGKSQADKPQGANAQIAAVAQVAAGDQSFRGQ